MADATSFALLQCSVSQEYQIKSNQIKYYLIVRPKVDQRAGQLCVPHRGVTKTEINRTKT